MSDYTPILNLVNQNARAASDALAECQAQCFKLEEMVVRQNEQIALLADRVDGLVQQVVLASVRTGSGPTA